MTSPLDIAREADRMGQRNGQMQFQQLAFYCLALTALASLAQSGSALWREKIRADREAQREHRGRG